MKKELEYFEVEGTFGGNQEWFRDILMYIGGCGAIAACDSCICFAKYHGMTKLYPYDPMNITKKEYCKFGKVMKPYISPRRMGVCKTCMFTDGFRKYLEDVNRREGTDYRFEIDTVEGAEPVEKAIALVKEQIDKNIPLANLMLRHTNKEKYSDFIWHWFMFVGYEETEDDFLVKIATYAETCWVSLIDLWNTGCEEKGGLIKLAPLGG